MEDVQTTTAEGEEGASKKDPLTLQLNIVNGK